MLYIAVCEDCPQQSSQLLEQLDIWLQNRGITAKVHPFASGQELLYAAFDTHFDLFLLDVGMPGMDSIRLGLELRRQRQEGFVIYITASPDFAPDSFEARAFAYLLKPVRPQQLFAVLDDVTRLQTKKRESALLVRTPDGTVRVTLDSILYVELHGRAALYHLRDGSTVRSNTLSSAFSESMEPLLRDPAFFLCGASYVVHLHYIKAVAKTGITFINGTHLPIPKRVYTALHKVWADYWLEGGDLRS